MKRLPGTCIYFFLKTSVTRQVVHTFSPSTQAEAGRFLWVWGQPGLQSKFQDSQNSIVKLCHKNKQTRKLLLKFSTVTLSRLTYNSNPFTSCKHHGQAPPLGRAQGPVLLLPPLVEVRDHLRGLVIQLGVPPQTAWDLGPSYEPTGKIREESLCGGGTCQVIYWIAVEMGREAGLVCLWWNLAPKACALPTGPRSLRWYWTGTQV